MTTRRTAEQIVDAIADGARDLFLERSPSAVTMREIAAKANVNLGLIHRYVGSKDDVVALVLNRHTERARDAIPLQSDPDATLAAIADTIVHRPASGRLFAGLILDGVDLRAMKNEFPLLQHLTQDRGEVDAAVTYALALGWEVFGPALLAAIDAAPSDTAVKDALTHALKAVAQP